MHLTRLHQHDDKPCVALCMKHNDSRVWCLASITLETRKLHCCLPDQKLAEWWDVRRHIEVVNGCVLQVDAGGLVCAIDCGNVLWLLLSRRC